MGTRGHVLECSQHPWTANNLDVPPMGGCANALGYSHIMEYYTAMKREGPMTDLLTRKDLKNTTRTERKHYHRI